MILGEIDLSIGAMYMFAPILFYKLDWPGSGCAVGDHRAGWSAWWSASSTASFVAIVGISSFVTTLGMLFALEGLSLIISHGAPVAMPGAQSPDDSESPPHGQRAHIVLTEKVNHIGTFAKIFGEGVYSELIWAVVIVVIAAGRADVHPLGPVHGGDRLEQAGRCRGGGEGEAGDRSATSCCAPPPAGSWGSSRRCARRRSSRTRRVRTKSCAWRSPAAVIGGTLLTGGSGTVVGALIGALFLGILNDGLILKGVNANYQLFYMGLAIIVAMTVNVYVRRVRRGSGSG